MNQMDDLMQDALDTQDFYEVCQMYRHSLMGAKEFEALKDWVREYAKKAVEFEIDSIINLLMIQHEAAAGRHNYWQVAANLIQAERR